MGNVEGGYLVGLPVAVSIGEDGAVSVAVCLEELGVALREEGASDSQVEAAEAAFRRNRISVGRT